jgi:hypothetical protein
MRVLLSFREEDVRKGSITSGLPPLSDIPRVNRHVSNVANTGSRGIALAPQTSVMREAISLHTTLPCERLREPELQVSKSIVTLMVRQTTVLRAGRDEETHHFLFTCIVLSQAHVHPAVFRFARRKVSFKNGFTVLRCNDHVGGTVAGRRNSSHTLDGRTVFVVTALVWIPVMCAG